MTDEPMICGDVDGRLPDYLEETLDEGTRRRVRLHLTSCDRCSSLIAQLESIRVDAAALPALTPSRDLWAGISARIETPVIALGASDTPFGRRSPAWLIGAIAAGLVFATAGITHVLTRQSMEREFASAVRADSPVTVAAAGQPQLPVDTTVSVGRTVTERRRQPQTGAVAEPVVEEVGSRQESAAGPVRLVARTSVDRTYDREIVRLRAVLRQRRAQLDPETVTVIEQSLRVIDNAIAQSRAALAKDPASAFLRDQLDSSLEKKVDLLRTAALLPART